MYCPICGAGHTTCGGPAQLRYPPTDIDPMAPLNLTPASSKQMWRNDTGERIYLDVDGKVVKDESQDPVKFLVGETGEIPLDRAKALGLVRDEEVSNLTTELVKDDAALKRAKADLAAANKRADDAEAELAKLKNPGDSFEVDGLPHQAVEALKNAGLWSRDALGGKTDDELTALPGVGAATVEKIRKALEG